MAFEVGIKITAESQLEAVKAAEAAVRNIGAAAKEVGAGGTAAAAGLDPLEKAHVGLTGASRALKSGLSQVVEQLGLTGPAAHVAGFAMLHLDEGFTAVMGSALAAGAGLTAAISSFKFLSEEKANFDKAFKAKDIAFFNEDLERTREILGTRTEGFFSPLVNTAGMIAGAIGIVDKRYVLGFGQMYDKIAADQRALKILSEQAAHDIARPIELQTEALRAMIAGDPILALTKQRAIAMEEMAKKIEEKGITGAAAQRDFASVGNEFLAKAEATRIGVGKPLVAGSIRELGLDANFTNKEINSLSATAYQLEQLFQAGRISGDDLRTTLRGMTEDSIRAKTEVKDLGQEWKGWISAGGKTQDLFGPVSQTADFRTRLLDIKETLNDLSRTPFALNPNQFEKIMAQLDAVQQAARVKYGIDIPPDIESAIEKLKQKTLGIAGEKKLTLDANQFVDEAERAKQKIDLIPNEKRVTLTMGGGPVGGLIKPGQTSFTDKDLGLISSGITLSPGVKDIQAAFGELAAKNYPITMVPEVKYNPTVPFAQFFRSDGPNLVQGFADKVNATNFTFDTNFAQAVVGTMNEIVKAKEELALRTADTPFRAALIGDFSVGPRARLAALEETYGQLMSLAKHPAATPSGGGGGGGGIVFNAPLIDMSNSTITSDAVDKARRELLPAIENTLRQATGRDPGFMVLN